ncbi:hypothetical protein HBI81_235390 [Parastagonospora nodorum]|nr:hypothetical protein HBH42_192630 [Parastagonospora nodorum]KAH4748331.1 hypothetical protein HBH65_191760 [Parastagonospora nodorum]KAH4803190.1 hypothetical protein HBH61_177820 [Parastagonospora nodorum]KAH5296060.1 hypothetical protein HBI50_228460 [Parastagonospora nodorum]KAH5990666.1 hypothetical protein HBI82_192540 [Parastagonospora nodorum]
MPSFSTLVLAALAAAAHLAIAARKNGYCGSSKDYCGDGCQTGWGSCTTGPAPVIQSNVSKNGDCGTRGGATCLGSTFGDCCSQYGYCGSNRNYCGKGCNPLYGKCSASEQFSTSSAPPKASPPSTLSVPSASPSSVMSMSNNGRCGSLYNASPKGMTCSGSKYGNCCSQYSYCGSSKDYCGKGCQPGFGDCDAIPLSSSSSAASSSTALTTSTTSSSTSSSVNSPIVASLSSTSSNVVSIPVASSSTPTVSSTTVVTTAAPVPSATSVLNSDCGTHNYPNGFTGSYYEDFPADLEECSTRCLNQDRCKSLLVRSGADCFLYDIPYDTTGIIPVGYIAIYQRSCFAARSITTSLEIQSSATSSSSVLSLSSSVPASSSTELLSSTSIVPLASAVMSTSTSAPTPLATFTPVGECGVHKDLWGIDKYDYYSFLSRASVEQCAAFCLSQTHCTFFTVSVSAQNPSCLLYNFSYTYTQTESSEATTLYQRSCFSPQ